MRDVCLYSQDVMRELYVCEVVDVQIAGCDHYCYKGHSDELLPTQEWTTQGVGYTAPHRELGTQESTTQGVGYTGEYHTGSWVHRSGPHRELGTQE